MLFDLRSRGRRRTVQVLYVGLAVLIGAGLILFGVGTGSGGGGLFGAFTGNNSSSSNHAVTSQVKKALATTKAHPNSAAAWSTLLQARFSAANSVGYDSNTNVYTASGKQQLQGVVQAYSHYNKLTHKPSVNNATLSGEAYSQLGDWKAASATYQTLLAAEPGALRALECVTLTSYAAGNTRVAQLAQAQALAKLPKTVRKTDKTEFESAKTNKTIVTETCG